MSHNCEEEHHHGGHGGHGHGHDDHSHVAPIPTNESQSLRQYIDTSKITGLNLSNPNNELHQVFKDQEQKYDVSKYIESDADAQLILNIPFTGYVKIFSIILRTSGDSSNCPKQIKIFKNKDNLDFDNANDSKPTYKIEQPLIGHHDNDTNTSNNDEFIEHYLPRNSFQSTTQLSLFIENNWDDDEDELTKVYYIEIRGQFTSPLSKDPIITLYESAANPADHKNLLANEVGNHASFQ
ncbi:hypothetical protein BN7_4454 [Wickerhamomyces ciferrii]|uniref:PITH domain-containing protein n=1 Tax=Wickerhamomyces ciferrii (strain ATCC 14091 / BCRC 22168 / CBS 111 / JCM 3599 / NBRC 0793 / NRRL Y-1031 F-60-10) TaxID=1206466 RepID=K0KI49_WICCF|nr:uncharacterized protein BN7_4454 [Wickerhamomyces ciferrii]CCH44885.1 hypothetical protein BN7_4454 [Wickerhamomyces ciferrii]